MRAGVRKGGMRVAPVARLSQLGCLCLTTWIVVTMRVRDVGDAQGGLARSTKLMHPHPTTLRATASSTSNTPDSEAKSEVEEGAP
jgi:hypothetical protein